MTWPAGGSLVAGIVLLGGLLASWYLPILSVVTVWPLLLVLPGWTMLGRLSPRIGLAGRIGIGVVISVAVSTHLVYWLSIAVGGYARVTVFVVAGLLGIATVLLAPRPPRAAVVRNGLPALLVAGIASLVVGVTLAVGMWRVTPTGVTSGGSNWSDLGVHLSIAQSLNAGGNFPPEVPYFAGAPLTYHWFADFHAAMLALAAERFSVPAMVVQSTVLAGTLALLVFALARALVRGRRARRVATIAAILAVFGGGLGYVRFIGDLTAGLGSPLELVARTSYDNQWLTGWPFFRIPSVMGTGLLAHRATTAGLPILVGSILLLVATLPPRRWLLHGARDRPAGIALAGLLGALLAPFHFFFFPVAPLLGLAWVLAADRLRDAAAPRNAVLYLAPYVLAVPFAVAPALQAGGSGALGLVAGWPSAPREDGIAAVAFFYVTNLGLPFLLGLAALLLPGLRHRAFLAAWTLGLFLLPNVAQFSVIDFDMNKYFQAMWISIAVLAAWLVRRWPGPAVALVVAVSVPSPFLVAAWTATSDLQVLSRAELAASRWVAEETPPDAVFVTDGFVNALTDAAGRKRLTTFGPYIANLGFAPDARIADVAAIYCGGDAGRSAELMRRHGATHLVDGARPQPCEAPVDFASAADFELVYDDGPLIWRLAN